MLTYVRHLMVSKLYMSGQKVEANVRALENVLTLVAS